MGGLAFTGTASAAPARKAVDPASSWTAHAGSPSNLASNAQVSVKVWLAARNTAALNAFVASVSNPHSSNYGAYLTADQYRAQYAPSAGEVSAVSSWLKGAGLGIDGTGPDNHFVAAHGSPAAIEAAFAAGVRQFTVNGGPVTGTTAAVTAPSSVAATVTAVTGLDTLAHQTHPNAISGDTNPDVPGTNQGHRVDLGPAPGFVNAGPCSSYYGEKVDTSDTPPAEVSTSALPYAVCGYTPAQLRSVYGVTASGLTGRGVTVAITDAFVSPTLQKDADTYATKHGDRAFSTGQFSQSNDRGYNPQRVADCGGNGWYGEQTLDVEAVHGMAPDANVVYYGAASCYDDDLMASMARAVSENKASLVSNSWGEPSFVVVNGQQFPTIDNGLIAAYEGILKQGAAQGIGFYFSSGDSGDDAAVNGGQPQADYPSADPYVTAVGGTALAAGSTGSRQFETGWGTEKYSLTSTGWSALGFLYGAGGGIADSTAYPALARPDYQTKAGFTASGRSEPDIAADADPTTGMLVGETQAFAAPNVWGQGTHYGEYRIGGTSLASPLIAGINADAQQGRSRIGFANPMLYGLRKGTLFDVNGNPGDAGNVRVDYANGYNDASGTKISIRTFNQDSSLTTGPGWDDVTGLGTPTLAYLHTVNAG
jgi:subtilase family serine protease